MIVWLLRDKETKILIRMVFIPSWGRWKLVFGYRYATAEKKDEGEKKEKYRCGEKSTCLIIGGMWPFREWRIWSQSW